MTVAWVELVIVTFVTLALLVAPCVDEEDELGHEGQPGAGSVGSR
jgi:hypothetical protein